MTERGPEPLIEEALNLACHGARAQDQNFNIALERDLDPTLSRIKVVPQDVTRVFLNLIGNGFYAANKRSREAGDDLGPLLQVGLCLAGRSCLYHPPSEENRAQV